MSALERKLSFRSGSFVSFQARIFATLLFASIAPIPAVGQNVEAKSMPVIVQPGAPGEQSRILPSTTRAVLPPLSAKDVEFMQGMIMHHAQAVEMTAFIEGRTANKEIRRLGVRISQSQSAEINYMKRWLEARGETVAMEMSGASGTHSHGGQKAGLQMLMPGMLTAEQMAYIKKSSSAEFDKLFLNGMIQHHDGALRMVKDLFDSPGSGQDAELFNFASDVDNGQRAEIKIMKTILENYR